MTDGLLVEVLTMSRGSATTAVSLAGDSTVSVEDPTDFDDTGGQVKVAGVVYDYTGVDDDASELLLAEPLDNVVAEDEPVEILIGDHVAVDYYALVDLGTDDGELVWVPLRTREARVAWPVRVYDPPLPVTLSDDLSSIVDAPGVVPDIDASLIPTVEINDPVEAPTVANYYTKVTTELVNPVGLCRNAANTGWVTYNPTGPYLVEYDDDGNITATGSSVGWSGYIPWGLTRIGSVYYVVSKMTGAGGDVVLMRFNSSLHWTTEHVLDSSPPDNIELTLGTAGSDLAVVSSVSGGTGVSAARWTTASPPVEVVGSPTVLSDLGSLPGGAHYGLGDFAVTRWFVHPQTSGVKVYNTAGVEVPANGWPRPGGKTITGLWWDGTYFWTIATDGVIRRYETAADAPEGTYDWAYAYVDSDTHTTLVSPITTKERVKRAAIKVTAPAAPQVDETSDHAANRIAIYGADTGSTLTLQTTLAAGASFGVFTGVTTTGAAPPPKNTWKTAVTDEDIADYIASKAAGFDVILLAGQSNMVGLGTPIDLTYLDNTDTRVKQWAGSGGYLGKAVTAVDALLHHGAVNNTVGLGMSFAKWWADRTGRRVLLVPCAHGGTGFTTTSKNPPVAGYRYTSITAGNWDPDSTDGGTSLFDFAVAQATAALASDPANKLVAILWQQGAADGSNYPATALTEAQFASRTDALIDGLRASIPGATGIPVVVGREPRDWYAARPADDYLDRVHLDTHVRKTGTAWAVPAALGQTSDGAHANAAAQRLAGGTYYPEAYLIAEKNILGVAPVAPVGTITATQVGTTLTVYWPRPQCRATNYLVQKDTGTGWTTVTRTASTINEQAITGLTLGTDVQVRVATINEQGTSSNSVSVTFRVKDIPAVPTGLAAIPTAWSASLTWNAATDADSYLVGYKKAADATWIEVANTDTSVTIGGLAPSTSYNFRVKSVNGAGTSAASGTVTASTLAPTVLSADVGSSPAWAWGLRKMVTGYAGSAIRVRRSSDNVEADIGFDVNGDLDTAALLAHCGANSGFVRTVYNQGTVGSAADAVQATAGFQPRIVLAGVVDTKNSRPAMKLDGSDDFLQSNSPGILNSALGATVFAVSSTRSANKGLISEMAASGTSSSWVGLYYSAGLQPWTTIRNSDGTLLASAVASTAVTDDDSLNQETEQDTTTTLTIRRNGTATSVNGTGYTRAGTFAPTRVLLGAFTAGTGHDGYISEIAMWTDSLAQIVIEAGEANQRGYYATP